MKLTKKQLLAWKPCKEGLAFAEARNFDFVRIWHECPNWYWLLWLLFQLDILTDTQSHEIYAACYPITKDDNINRADKVRKIVKCPFEN